MFFLSQFSFSQNSDNDQAESYLSGKVSVTTKGISTIPSFTLGKPAVIFDLSIGKGKLSFDPLMRFDLNGKPWSFIFWWHYKVMENDRFRLRAGVHPAFIFKTVTMEKNGVSKEMVRTYRYLAAEIIPEYSLTKNISVGPYYNYARAIEKDAAKNTHYIALRASISNLKLSDQYSFSFSPQAYFLKIDEKDGFYFSSGFSLSRKDFPFSISSIINKKIQSDIASEDFLWNVSLVYSFRKKYIRR